MGDNRGRIAEDIFVGALRDNSFFLSTNMPMLVLHDDDVFHQVAHLDIVVLETMEVLMLMLMLMLLVFL